MKKLVLFSVFAALVAGGAFALPEFKLGAGAGGYFTGDFAGGVKGDGYSTFTPYFAGGGFAFFDATYAELSLGIFGGSGEWQTHRNNRPTVYSDVSLAGLDIGLLVKYPFFIKKFSIFPLLGINYRAVFSAKMEDEEFDNPEDLGALWFKFGGGLDYFFTDNIFLRGEALYGLRLKNEFEDDNSGSGVDSRLGHGLEVKIAVGYQF
jgi:hypothetical protein